MNRRVAERLHELLPTSELFLLAGAHHFVQMDEPQEVARLILMLEELVVGPDEVTPPTSNRREDRGRG